jgi:rhamnose transport system permease protein
VHEGIVASILLWNTVDLGYLTVHAADALARGELSAGASSFEAGRLGALQVRGDNVVLGVPFRFDASNIDRFEF